MRKVKTILLYFFAIALTSIAVAMTIHSNNYNKQHPITEKFCNVQIYDKEKVIHNGYHFASRDYILYYLDENGDKKDITVSDSTYKKYTVGDVITLEYEERDGAPIPDSYKYADK